MEYVNIFKKKNCIIIGLLLFVFMIIGSFYDYQISTVLLNQKSTFGILLASYGQVPAMLCFSIGGTLLMKITSLQNKVKLVISYTFGILLNAFAIMGITMDPMLYMDGMSMALSLIIAVALVLIVDVIFLKLTRNANRDQLKKFVILILGVVLIEIILINIIKVPWARPRMRMIATNGEASFQPWWIIGSNIKENLMALGVAAEEFKSFPSGHTGNAACTILLGALPLISNNLKGKEDMLFLIGVAFTFIVAFSRVIMGAHFLTDVTVGMSLTFIIEVILIFILWKRGEGQNE